jgi:hypothetical protein
MTTKTVIPTSALENNLREYIITPFVEIYGEGEKIILVPKREKPLSSFQHKLLGKYLSNGSATDDFIEARHAENKDKP